MKKTVLLNLLVCLCVSCSPKSALKETAGYCLTGAFLADAPTKSDIARFQSAYGKKPYLVLVFIDWNSLPDKNVIADVYGSGSALMVSWEPWEAKVKRGIDFQDIYSGKHDRYLTEFSKRLKAIQGEVFVRFAHEMNGNWYPWSGGKIGKETFVRTYRYIKDFFDKEKVLNVRWVFSVNWEDVPAESNSFLDYYPGDSYADFVGIDGYNWGTTQPWSRWMSFREIFEPRYREISGRIHKPILITEFGCAGPDQDKQHWIRDAMQAMRSLGDIKGFVLFNQDKEADWGFVLGTAAQRELAIQLKDPYFKESIREATK